MSEIPTEFETILELNEYAGLIDDAVFAVDPESGGGETQKLTGSKFSISSIARTYGVQDSNVSLLEAGAVSGVNYLYDTSGQFIYFVYETLTGNIDSFQLVAKPYTVTVDGNDHNLMDPRFFNESKGYLHTKAFFSVVDGITNDYTPVQLTYDFAIDSGIEKFHLGEGETAIANTLTMNSGVGCAIIGLENNRIQTGSDLPSSTLVWTGGNESMISVYTSYNVFKGFAVENRGTAARWAEFNAGAIAHTFDGLSFINGSGHTKFTESVIKSNGNRMGYSKFLGLQVKFPADVFLETDGQGTGNNITPAYFDERCIFESSATDTMTVVKVKDESYDALIFKRTTFNQKGVELTIVDVTDMPLASTLPVLVIEDCEIDILVSGSSETDRMLKLVNVDNFSFRRNNIAGGGTVTSIGDLQNVNVTVGGCYYRSINGPMFTLDADSRGDAETNHPDKTNTKGVFNLLKTVGVEQLQYQPVMLIDNSLRSGQKTNTFEVNVTDNLGWQIRILSGSSQVVNEPGQNFRVHVKNISGGSISAGNFTNGFKVLTSNTAPPDGQGITYEFYWNGEYAYQTNIGPLVPN